MFSNGALMGEAEKALGVRVQPGEEMTVSIEFKAPVKPGKYCSFYQLQCGQEVRIGAKYWCEILVREEG